MELYEDYQSPFDFDEGVNKNYLYLSPSGNPSPPGSPAPQKCGNYALSEAEFAMMKPGHPLGSAWL